MLKLLFLLLKIFLKGGDDMTVIYVALIIKGKKTFAQVPTVIKEQVKQVLIDLDLTELAE